MSDKNKKLEKQGPYIVIPKTGSYKKRRPWKKWSGGSYKEIMDSYFLSIVKKNQKIEYVQVTRFQYINNKLKGVFDQKKRGDLFDAFKNKRIKYILKK